MYIANRNFKRDLMRFRTLVYFLLLISGLFGCKNLEKTRTIKLAHGLDVNHSVHFAMVKMGVDLKELSGGKAPVSKFIPVNSWEQNVNVWNFYKLEVLI